MAKPRLHITTSPVCSNKCVFCVDNLREDVVPSGKDVEKNILRNLKDNRKRFDSVLFTSGEPTLNKNLADYIAQARKLKYEKISLVTNGRKMSDRKFCEQLLAAGLDEVNFSIHGSNKNIHDKVTGRRGSFEQAFAGLENLASFKKKYKFTLNLNFTVNKLNISDMAGFLKKIKPLEDIDGIVFNAVMPYGRAKDNFDRVVPRYSEAAEEFKKAVRWADRAPDLRRKINIYGVPPCLLAGYEGYLRSSEKLYMKNYHLPEDESRNKPKEAAKGEKCPLCRHFDRCDGVYVYYIKKNGWSEFSPILL